MALYLIERNFAEQLNMNRDVATAVVQVNSEVGIQWLFSFLSADKKKTYCLYEAPNPEAIRDAARKLNLAPSDCLDQGFPQRPLIHDREEHRHRYEDVNRRGDHPSDHSHLQTKNMEDHHV